jgi:hypothetical protein
MSAPAELDSEREKTTSMPEAHRLAYVFPRPWTHGITWHPLQRLPSLATGLGIRRKYVKTGCPVIAILDCMPPESNTRLVKGLKPNDSEVQTKGPLKNPTFDE